MWLPLQRECAKHQITAEWHGTKLRATFPNGSEIRLVGADSMDAAERKRGDKTKCEIVLEAQGFGVLLKAIVEDVVEPCLSDENGTLYLEGTPGLVCNGFWFDVSGGVDDIDRWSKLEWSCHRLNYRNNPFLREEFTKEQEEKKKKKGWTDDHPVWKREYLGRWVVDASSTYYKFDALRNTYTPVQMNPVGPGWSHVLGLDIGWTDKMAIVVWGWHPDHPALYQAYEWAESGQLEEDVMARVTELENSGYNIIAKVADMGGGGKLFIEGLHARFGHQFEPAAKSEKYRFAQLFSDDLLSRRAYLKAGGEYAEEIAQLPKDPDSPEDGMPKEHPKFDNHLCDAGLYSWRQARHYHFVEAPPPIEPGSTAWEDAEIARLEEKLTKPPEEWWEEQGDDDW